MKINPLNTFKDTSEQNKIDVDIKNPVSKPKNRAIENTNTNLDANINQLDIPSDISGTIDSINCLYLPIQSTLKSLSLSVTIYNKGILALKDTSLTETERNKIELELNSAKNNILTLTSKDYISMINNYIAKNVVPKVAEAEDILKKEIGHDIDTSKFEITSMGNLGINPAENFNFSEILNEVSKAINSWGQKKLNLGNLDKKYGDVSNKHFKKILDTYN